MKIEEVLEKYNTITRKLIEKGLWVTTMESMTAGLIASLLTDTEGASAVMKGAFVTYSNEAKARMGVPANVIAEHSVYSRETAEAMAMACARQYGADIGVGVTGTSGNIDPANMGSSVPGTVYAAVYMDGKTCARTLHIPRTEEGRSRVMCKFMAADMVADMLMMLF